MAGDIRTLTANDWTVWRDLRLRATAESPDAFRPTFEEEQAYGNDVWQDMVTSTAEHPRGNLWVAELDGRHVAMAFARIDEDRTTVYIGAMWVAPEARREGIGDALVAAAIEWGEEAGVQSAELWVTEANLPAVRFYESHGFVPTGDTDVLREGSDLVVRKLVRKLAQ